MLLGSWRLRRRTRLISSVERDLHPVGSQVAPVGAATLLATTRRTAKPVTVTTVTTTTTTTTTTVSEGARRELSPEERAARERKLVRFFNRIVYLLVFEEHFLGESPAASSVAGSALASWNLRKEAAREFASGNNKHYHKR